MGYCKMNRSPKKTWHIQRHDPDHVDMLARSCGCHPIVAGILINRAITDPKEATDFLNPSLANLRSPFLMKNMAEAVERIVTAVEKEEKILIFGDYDVDGVTGTTLLLEFLLTMGADVSFYLPDRFREGYGLNRDYILQGAVPDNVRLLITVDCGISSVEAVRAANDHNIDVIVTDHHEIPEVLPDAFAILNPKQADCSFPFRMFAGVGVVFCLVLALRKHLRDKGFWINRSEPNLKNVCDLVALGTVADIVPILEENRILVQAGLEILTSRIRPGLNALQEVSGLSNVDLNTWDIAFKLAPRINAAGRLVKANVGVELLTAPDRGAALPVARFLNETNSRRQRIEKDTLDEAIRLIDSNPDLLRQRSLVLCGEGWNEGVIGIVASKLVGRYYRPVVLISVKNGTGKGSARSISGFNLYEGLKECAEYLDRFGGHKAAAGLSLPSENISDFAGRFERVVCTNTTEQDFIPKIEIDRMVRFDEIDTDLMNQIERLAPFGTGNPEPFFAAEDVRIIESSVVGGSHVRMNLQQGNHLSRSIQAIMFNGAAMWPLPDKFQRIAFNLRWNRWQNKKTLQMIIREAE